MKAVSSFVLATVAMVAAPQLALAGPIWTDSNGVQHEYQLVANTSLSWTGARDAAVAAGWHLATVTSAAENTFIVANVLPATTSNRAHYWIGGSDAATEGSFTWVTGETWNYTNFWLGEPNNVNNEDYLAYDFREGWAWNDASNTLAGFESFLRGYIIERTLRAAVPEPATLALLGLGLLGLGLARKKRQR